MQSTPYVLTASRSANRPSSPHAEIKRSQKAGIFQTRWETAANGCSLPPSIEMCSKHWRSFALPRGQERWQRSQIDMRTTLAPKLGTGPICRIFNISFLVSLYLFCASRGQVLLYLRGVPRVMRSFVFRSGFWLRLSTPTSRNVILAFLSVGRCRRRLLLRGGTTFFFPISLVSTSSIESSPRCAIVCISHLVVDGSRSK